MDEIPWTGTAKAKEQLEDGGSGYENYGTDRKKKQAYLQEKGRVTAVSHGQYSLDEGIHGRGTPEGSEKGYGIYDSDMDYPRQETLQGIVIEKYGLQNKEKSRSDKYKNKYKNK